MPGAEHGAVMETLPKPAGVIVADDDPLIRSVLKRKLEEFGQTVYQATNGVEAVALAANLDASLILLDIKMPRLDGLQACAQIRELPGYDRTPIVMLTFQDNRKAQVSASRAGATMFLVKPFGMATLMLALSRFLPINEVTQKTIYADAVRATGGQVFIRPSS